MLLTRCPHCATVFRVSDEQLAARNGRVRCGQCRKAFNAMNQALDPDLESMPASAIAPTPPLADLTPPANGSSFAAPAHPNPSPQPDRAAPTRLPDDRPLPPATEARQAVELAAALEEHFRQEPSLGNSAFSSTPEPLLTPVPDPLFIPTATLSTEDPPPPDSLLIDPPTPDEAEADALLQAPETTPVAPAPATAAPRDTARPPLWPFVLAGFCLTLLLLGQLAHRYRTELSSQSAGVRSLFAALGVDVPLPRRSELIGIEDSDLQADTARNLLVLTAHLKNRASYAQAYPALEISLTDARDAVLLRRVLQPADYLPADAPTPPAQFIAGGELPLKLWLDPGNTGATGYRLYVFYP